MPAAGPPNIIPGPTDSCRVCHGGVGGAAPLSAWRNLAGGGAGPARAGRAADQNPLADLDYSRSDRDFNGSGQEGCNPPLLLLPDDECLRLPPLPFRPLVTPLDRLGARAGPGLRVRGLPVLRKGSRTDRGSRGVTGPARARGTRWWRSAKWRPPSGAWTPGPTGY